MPLCKESPIRYFGWARGKNNICHLIVTHLSRNLDVLCKQNYQRTRHLVSFKKLKSIFDQSNFEKTFRVNTCNRKILIKWCQLKYIYSNRGIVLVTAVVNGFQVTKWNILHSQWLAQKYMITFSRRRKAFVAVINRHQLIFYWNHNNYIYSAVIYLQIRVKLLLFKQCPLVNWYQLILGGESNLLSLKEVVD